MGHSDAFTHQELARIPATGNAQDAGVRVWGDTESIVISPSESDTDANTMHERSRENDNPGGGENLYSRIGHLTRTLHDALRALGYHEELVDAHSNLPDARDRLAYIARLTGDAAEKVLNSVDRARALQDELGEGARGLATRWAAVASYTAGGDRATPAGAVLVDETRAFFAKLGEKTHATNTVLTEIMMAQDFHDLTGQVIRRVVTLAQTLEEQLLKLLVESTPPEQRKKVDPAALEGPVVNAEGRADVVTDQAAVDDLLASLGF